MELNDLKNDIASMRQDMHNLKEAVEVGNASIIDIGNKLNGTLINLSALTEKIIMNKETIDSTINTFNQHNQECNQKISELFSSYGHLKPEEVRDILEWSYKQKKLAEDNYEDNRMKRTLFSVEAYKIMIGIVLSIISFTIGLLIH